MITPSGYKLHDILNYGNKKTKLVSKSTNKPAKYSNILNLELPIKNKMQQINKLSFINSNKENLNMTNFRFQ